LWAEPQRWYLLAEKSRIETIEKLLGNARVYVIRESGGKYLISNQPVTENALLKQRRHHFGA
jgi:hypothetical protein